MRPVKRGDCAGIPRPCVYTECKWHLLHRDQARGPGGRHPKHLRVVDTSESCSLDVADKGQHTLQEVADFYGITREAIRQIEERAILKLMRSRSELDRPPERGLSPMAQFAQEK